MYEVIPSMSDPVFVTFNIKRHDSIFSIEDILESFGRLLKGHFARSGREFDLVAGETCHVSGHAGKNAVSLHVRLCVGASNSYDVKFLATELRLCTSSASPCTARARRAGRDGRTCNTARPRTCSAGSTCTRVSGPVV
jgi:hypothetical protein